MRPLARLAASMLVVAVVTPQTHAQTVDAFNPSPLVYPTSLAMQADGKIVIVGNFPSVGTSTRTRVARLDADGSVDPTFADPVVDSEVKTVAVQSDGKLLIGGGFTHVGGQVRHYLARLNDDGSLDTGFADPNLDGTVWAIAIQPDGKVLAGGDFTHVGTTARNYFARFDANGSFDTGFADTQLCCNVVRAVALQADGHVLIGGAFSHVGSVSHFYLARFSSDGTFDPSFPNVSDSIVLLADNIVVTPDGAILLGGSGTPSMRRLHADGTLDSTFNGATADGSVNSIALQPNGKLLIAGNFQQVGGQPRHALARLNADGSLDAAFGDPHFSADAGHPNGSIYGIVAQADGNAVVTGNFTLVDGAPRQYMARVVTGDYVTSVLVVQGNSSGLTANWYRSGDGPELAQPPILEHSTDGLNFTPVGAMARIANGWSASANYDVHGARFYLRALGSSSGGADNGAPGQVASEVYSSDTIFAWGFE